MRGTEGERERTGEPTTGFGTEIPTEAQDATTGEISVPDYVLRDFDAEAPEIDPSHVEARKAAAMLGVSKRAVRNLVASGRLESERDGDGPAARLLVSVASVERLRSEKLRAGRG